VQKLRADKIKGYTVNYSFSTDKLNTITVAIVDCTYGQ